MDFNEARTRRPIGWSVVLTLLLLFWTMASASATAAARPRGHGPGTTEDGPGKCLCRGHGDSQPGREDRPGFDQDHALDESRFRALGCWPPRGGRVAPRGRKSVLAGARIKRSTGTGKYFVVSCFAVDGVAPVARHPSGSCRSPPARPAGTGRPAPPEVPGRRAAPGRSDRSGRPGTPARLVPQGQPG